MEADFIVLLVLLFSVGLLFSVFVTILLLLYGIDVVVVYRQLLKSRNRYDKWQ